MVGGPGQVWRTLFQSPFPGPGGCSLPFFALSGDYRSELQSMLQNRLIAGLRELDEQAKSSLMGSPGTAGLSWG